MSPSRTKALVELLKSLFSADELRRFAAFLPGGNVVAALPSGTASLETLAFEMVQALDRRGQIDSDFFARLEEERPGRKTEIARIRAQLLDANAPTAPLNEDPSVHLAAYAAWARQKYEYLPMRGLGGLRLDLRLEDVHVPLELMPRERGRFEVGFRDDAPAMMDPSTCTVRLEEAFGWAGPDRHLFVRGDPGTGKTTALTKMLWSVLDAAAEHGFDGRALGLPADTVPVFLPLRNLAGPALGSGFDDVLDDALVEMTRSPRRDGSTELGPGPSIVPPGFGRWLWQRGRVLLLLDGLDEIADPKARAKVCRYIENALDQVGPERVRAVVSSRFSGIQEEDEVTLDHRRFLHLDVRHLDDEQMADLVIRWFRAAGAALDRMRGAGAGAHEAQYQLEVQTVLQLLRSDAYASRQLKELVSTPLFLTLLCIVVFQGGQIPELRAEFFRECLRVLLMPWARRDGEQRLSLDESLDLLQHIAWFMHREQRRDDLGETELRKLLERPLRAVERHRERKLNVSSVIDWFRRTTGVLTEYATVPAEYGFLHLSLQEYLAARYAATYPVEGIETLATQFGSSWWREVALLFVALPEYGHFESLMEQIIARGKLLPEREHVYQCLLEAHARGLRPLLELIADRAAPITQRIEALRIVQYQDDDELIELASEIALEPLLEKVGEGSVLAGIELKLLAEQVEAHAPPRVDASPAEENAEGVLVICAPADEARARELERSMTSWGWHAGIAASLRAEDEPWRRARAVVVLVGPGGRSAWEETDSRRCLVEMVRRGLSVVSALSGGTDATSLPAFLQTRPHVSLGANVLESRLPAMLAGFLDVTVPELSVVMIETGPPDAHEGQSFLEEKNGIRFLWVPGGRSWMGSGADEDDAHEDERPRHLVEVSGYWLAETPVTNRQYEMFLREQRGSSEPSYWRDRKYNQPEQPVVGVSWQEASAFCRWLSELSGQRCELPSEAQWEFAARGEEGRTYPWGDDEPDETRARFGKDWGSDGTMRVGSQPAGRGPYGHLDLAGNVLEWCRDVWDQEAYKKRGEFTVNPEGPEAAEDDPSVDRACRGGAFGIGVWSLRCASRLGYRADGRYHGLGFRVAVLPTKG